MSKTVSEKPASMALIEAGAEIQASIRLRLFEREGWGHLPAGRSEEPPHRTGPRL